VFLARVALPQPGAKNREEYPQRRGPHRRNGLSLGRYHGLPCNFLGDLSGAYSRRINTQHRLVYRVLDEFKTVKVMRMWTHYE